MRSPGNTFWVDEKDGAFRVYYWVAGGRIVVVATHPTLAKALADADERERIARGR